MKSILIFDTNSERLQQLGLLLRLAKAPFHVVGSLEEACNQVATRPDALDRYDCLMINDIDTPKCGSSRLAILAQHRFPLPVLLVERFKLQAPAGELVFQEVDGLRVMRCQSVEINAALSLIASKPVTSAVA